MQESKNKAVIYMITCAVLWSTAGFLIKMVPWHPMEIAGFRSLISAAVYIAYMRYEKNKFVINKYSIASGISLSLTFIFFIAANKLTTAANAIVLQYSAPIFILILSALIFRQKFRRGDIITVLVTSVGISLFFLDKLSNGYMIGNLVALAAGVAFATMFVTTGNADKDSLASGILLGHLLTAVVGIPFVFFYETPVSLPIVGAMVTMGIFQLGIPYILYGIAVRKCSPLACSLISMIEPLLNPVWVFLINKEVPSPFALVGGFIVISAVTAWSIWSSKVERMKA